MKSQQQHGRVAIMAPLMAAMAAVAVEVEAEHHDSYGHSGSLAF